MRENAPSINNGVRIPERDTRIAQNEDNRLSDVRVFDNPEFGQVRTVLINNEPWFVGKDVAVALGYRDTVNALKNHVDNEDKIMGCQNTTPSIMDSKGRIQYPTWINESGVYALIFGSKLPSANKFKRWVTSEVLPSIHKTGGRMEVLPALQNNKETRHDTGDVIEKSVVMNICGVDCYEKDGVAYLKLETVARGLGFTTTQTVKGIQYVNVRWNRVDEYLEEIGFATCGKRPDFIPENIFYRLAMKAKNETAEKFQAKVADEIIPSIRKTGGYVANENTFIDTYLPFADEQTKMLFHATLQAMNNQNKIIAEQKETIADQQETISNQRETIQKHQPFIEFALTAKASEQTFSMEETAKILRNNGIDIGRNRQIRQNVRKDKKMEIKKRRLSSQKRIRNIYVQERE